MIYTVDVETQGFSKKVILGCICNERLQTETFSNGSDIWKRILELGTKAKGMRKNICVYAHNLGFDFFRIADLSDPEITWISKGRCMIVGYGRPNPYIYFLDSYAIMPMSLEKIAEQIGEKKGITHPKLLEEKEQKYTIEELTEIKEYCKNDVIVEMKAILHMKKKLKSIGIMPKRLMSAGQISMAAFNKRIKEMKTGKYNFFRWEEKVEKGKRAERGYWNNEEANEIARKAGRGGRVEAFKTGLVGETVNLDVNSLYPYCATLLNMPKFRYARKINLPLENYGRDELFSKIGASTVVLRKEKESEIGYLGVRNRPRAYYPGKKCTIIGTYTHEELQRAMKEGYRVDHVKESAIFEKSEQNPLKEAMLEWYSKRIMEPEYKMFWKIMMNYLIGKFSQTIDESESIVDDINLHGRYEKLGYSPIRIGLKGLYEKKTGKRPSNFFAPIVFARVTAKARTILYDKLTQIERGKLFYCNTDSVLTTMDQVEKFKVSEILGEWKIESVGDTYIRGINCLRIGENVKITGVGRKFVDKNKFDSGNIEYWKMTNRGKDGKEDLGAFEKIVESLNNREKEHEKEMEILENIDTYIDIMEEKDIKYYSEMGFLEGL